MTPPAVRFTSEPNVAAARTAFEASDPWVRVLFDYGGGSLGFGGSSTRIRSGLLAVAADRDSYAVLLGPNGSLSASGTTTGQASFRPDPSVRPAIDLPTGNAWAASPLRLDTRACGKWHRVPDAGIHDGHDDRGPCEPQPRIEVDCAHHRPSSHSHRGPSRIQAGGIRDFGLLAELSTGRGSGLDRTRPHTDLPRR